MLNTTHKTNALGALTTEAGSGRSKRPSRPVKRIAMLATAAVLMGAASGPAPASASHSSSIGYITCPPGTGAVGDSAPGVAWTWSNNPTNYASSYLYRWNGARWVWVDTGAQLIQYGGTSPWYQGNVERRGWFWFNRTPGWYAVQVKLQSYYTRYGWSAVEWGWADTNPNTAVGATMCYVGGGSMSGRVEPPKTPLSTTRALRQLPRAEREGERGAPKFSSERELLEQR